MARKSFFHFHFLALLIVDRARLIVAQLKGKEARSNSEIISPSPSTDLIATIFVESKIHLFIALLLPCIQNDLCDFVSIILYDVLMTHDPSALTQNFSLIPMLNTSISYIRAYSTMALTTNAISKMHEMSSDNDDPSFQPVVQVIHIKHIPVNNGGEQDRYKVSSHPIYVSIHVLYRV